jgi:hypothetical protein
MIIQREYDKEVIDRIKPNFVEDYGYTRDVCAEELKYYFDYPNAKDVICVVTAKDGDEYRGHLVAVSVYDRAVICQAYSLLHKEDAKTGFNMVKNWAKSLGLKEIRIETEKNSVLTRLLVGYGFRLNGYVMRLGL